MIVSPDKPLYFFMASNDSQGNSFFKDFHGAKEIQFPQHRSQGHSNRAIQKSKFVHQRNTKNGRLTNSENAFRQALLNGHL